MPIAPEIAIAMRLYFSQAGKKRNSRPAIRVALAGLIVGVLVMILTICIVVGFKKTVTEKVAGFGAHIQLVSFENNNTYDLQPIEVSDSLLTRLASFPYVRSAAPFVTKPGMLKTDSAFQGIVIKGTDYWDFFAEHLIEGSLPAKPQQILLSRTMAQLLHLHLNDAVNAYFVDDTDVRARRFSISGIYETGFTQFDQLFIITPLATAQRLLTTAAGKSQIGNNPTGDQSQITSLPSREGSGVSLYSGVEILLFDITKLDEVADEIYFATVNHLDERGYNVYYVQTLQQQNPAIFAWLDLLDMNVVVIIILMLLVSGFNIVSGLIILILDGVQLIGILKALGADNSFVRKIFLTQAAMIIGKGMFWGNIIGLALAAVQYFTHIIPLDPTTYFVSAVPVSFAWGWIVLLNLITLVVSMTILLLPAMIITRITPTKVMHFE